MTARHPIVDYAHRLLQIFGVTMGQLYLLAVRYIRKQPLDGPHLLREGLEKAGGTFVKFGQILSLQVDTLPREYCDALMGLLDRVPTASKAQVRAIFEAEFKMPPEDLYGKFEYRAIASASIGQVHRGQLID